jgi:hypothetical protein
MGTASTTPADWRTQCASSAVGSSYVGSGTAVVGSKMGESDVPEDEEEDVMLSLHCCGWLELGKISGRRNLIRCKCERKLG